jgi:ABC-type uncharacterized transport system substrate-binding protein
LLFLLLPGPATADNKTWIAIVTSDDSPVYTQTIQTFKAGIDSEIRLFSLHDDIHQAPELRNTILAKPPTLIFALGAKAAYAAKLWTTNRQEIPVLFAMVLNWQKYKLLEGQRNMAGISTEINPGNQFLNLSLLVSGIKKIGVIYSPGFSGELVATARQSTQMLGIRLVEQPIDSPQHFEQAYKKLAAEVDAIWVLHDPITYTLKNMDWLKERCIKDKLICIGQSENLVEAGILLSVRADEANIGAQAASMAINILVRNQQPAAIGVMEPLGTNIIVNRRTADHIGLKLSKQALGMVTDIID